MSAEPNLGDLGRAVADASDRASDVQSSLGLARRRLEERAAHSSPRRVAPALLVAAAVCGAALLLFALTPGREITFRVDDEPAVTGEWLSANSKPVGVVFSEGSRIDLRAGSSAHVREVSSDGAEFVLERGTAQARIVHRREATRWVVRAGPFAIRVTGTTFEATWDPSVERFEVVMTEGTVEVSGPLLPPARQVTAGERLVISLNDGSMSLTSPIASGRPAQPVPVIDANGGNTAEAQTANPRSSGTPQASAPATSVPAPLAEPANWQELARKGRQRQALEQLEQSGVEIELRKATSSELLLLADTARLGSKPALARDALLAARSRFGIRGRTAFLLGKIWADQLGNPTEAIRWFETQLAEDPGGSLEEQSLGRLMELKRNGRRPEARAHAQRYLAQFPSGAYTPLATSLIEP